MSNTSYELAGEKKLPIRYLHCCFSSRLGIALFLQGCQNLSAQMLLVLEAKHSINAKHKLLYLLQTPVMTICKHTLICIIFLLLVTWAILKCGGCLSNTEQFLVQVTLIVFLDIVRNLLLLYCVLKKLGKFIHPRSMHMHSPILWKHSCAYVISLSEEEATIF